MARSPDCLAIHACVPDLNPAVSAKACVIVDSLYGSLFLGILCVGYSDFRN